ncbi:hypothetical protein BZA77DRAFT_311647 [Pyronema omphalodes]|nr:hypothetical protein BZA77DRAFT_311647 [Pyronema omphalodes]
MNNSNNPPYKLPSLWNTNAANTSNRTNQGPENPGNVRNTDSSGNSLYSGHQGRRTSGNDNANVANTAINTGNSSTTRNCNDIFPRVTVQPPSQQQSRLPAQSASLEFIAPRDTARDPRIQDLLNNDHNTLSNSRNMDRFSQQRDETATSITGVRLAPLWESGQGRQSERATGAEAGDTNRAGSGAGQATATATNIGGTGHNTPNSLTLQQQQRVNRLLGGSGGGATRPVYNRETTTSVWNGDVLDPRYRRTGRGLRDLESEEANFGSERDEDQGSNSVHGWDDETGSEEEYMSLEEEEHEEEEDEEDDEGSFENMEGGRADEPSITGSDGWEESLNTLGPALNPITDSEGYQLPQLQTPVQQLGGGEGNRGLTGNGAAGNGDGNRNNSWTLPLPHRSTGTMASTINHNQNHNLNQNQQNQTRRSSNSISNIVDLTCSPPRRHQPHSTPNRSNQSRSAPNDSADQHSAKRRKTSGQGGGAPISEIITLDIEDSNGEAEESEQQEEQPEKKPPVIEEEKPKKLAGLACIICMEDEPVDLSVTPCGHMFCNSCLYNAIKTTLAAPNKVHGKCPVCRGKVAIKDIIILEVKERQGKGKQKAD